MKIMEEKKKTQKTVNAKPEVHLTVVLSRNGEVVEMIQTSPWKHEFDHQKSYPLEKYYYAMLLSKVS
jgi:hypothetical protein